jgi:hypothetical protein
MRETEEVPEDLHVPHVGIYERVSRAWTSLYAVRHQLYRG